MEKMMKICGKTPSATAKAISVNENGYVVAQKVWEFNNVVVAKNDQIRDTSKHPYPATGSVELDGYGIVGIKVINVLGKPVTLTLCEGGSYVANLYEDIKLSIPPNERVIILTADDFPMLNLMQSIAFRAQCAEAPTSGWLQITVIRKR